MSETKHSPEPWRVHPLDDAGRIDDAKGEQCAEAWPGIVRGYAESVARQDANMRRIVACVNACAGLPTEALERGALRAVLALISKHPVPAVVSAVLSQLHLPDDYGRLP